MKKFLHKLLISCLKYVDSIEAPGGWKINFRDLQEAEASITGSNITLSSSSSSSSSSSAAIPEGNALQDAFMAVYEHKPYLALVDLRIEIEKTIRKLSKKHNISEKRSLSATIYDLVRKNILNNQETKGLLKLIKTCNNAAHGIEIEHDIVEWAVEAGPRIIEYIEEKLKS